MFILYFFRSAIYGVTSFGLSCAHNMFPGVYAKITKKVKEWIQSVTTGTQDECNASQDYVDRIRLKKMKKSADFKSDDLDTKDEEDQTNRVNKKTVASNKVDKSRADQKNEINLSYVRRLLALLQSQGKVGM